MNIVNNIQQINDWVQRLTTSENFIVDVHRGLFNCAVNDYVKIVVTSEKPSDCDYISFGEVYHSTSNDSCVSMGCMLCYIPEPLPIYSKVYVGLQKMKTKRRVANREKNTQGKKKRLG
jgi:hypothetical protein